MFTEKGLTPIDRQLNKKVVKIIHGLLTMQQSAAFRKPVPHKALGLEDYKMIVKKPTDLNLIRRQNNEGKYKFVEEILDEIQLCWDNCKLYNAIGSEIFNQALFLEQTFDKLGQEILPDFWEGINRQGYNAKFNQKKIEEEKNKKPQSKAAIMKSDPPSLSKADSHKQKNRKQVTFHSKQMYESSENLQEEPFSRGAERQKQSINENDPVEDVNPDPVNTEKISMDVEDEQQGQSAMAVEPIMVNLYQSPSREQLLELSQSVKNLYVRQDFATLQKVLQVLHSYEKENMSLTKNGLMSFKMNKIHVSTYNRIRKLLGGGEETLSIIE